MQNTDMYPPGRVLWAMREGDLHPSHQLQQIPEGKGAATTDKDKLRLFEVLDVEKVFSQIVFARDMLTSVYIRAIPTHLLMDNADHSLQMLFSAHMPHQYDRVLYDLL